MDAFSPVDRPTPPSDGATPPAGRRWRLRLGRGIAAAAGLGVLGIGCGYLLAPDAMAASFGTDISGTRAIHAVKGVRDVVSGIVALWAVATLRPAHLSALLAIFALIPAGDAVIVAASGGSLPAAVGIHGGTAALMLAGAGLLRSRRAG